MDKREDGIKSAEFLVFTENGRFKSLREIIEKLCLGHLIAMGVGG